MSREMKEEDELDRLALRSLELVECLLTERRSLELVMRQGFLHMAKSRYTMGKNSVSCLQLPSDNDSQFESLAKVKTLTTVEGTLSKTQFLLDVAQDEKSDSSSSLRRRAGTDREKTSSPPEKTDRDPIRWFGILVPQNLRTCQRHFKEAVAASCRIATYQNELEAVRAEYKRLLAAAKVSSSSSSSSSMKSSTA